MIDLANERLKDFISKEYTNKDIDKEIAEIYEGNIDAYLLYIDNLRLLKK